MHLEAVTVCVNYGDFLAHTLPHNIAHFDRLVVVTSPSDHETIGLCKHYGVSCVESDFHTEDGDPFNKGRLINLGLAHLRQSDWILHLDADIALPDRFRHMLKLARLDKECIYGADRYSCRSPEEWNKYKAAAPQWKHHYLLDMPKLEQMARLVHFDYGYCPIGFFQLWHNHHQRIYPIHSGGLEHSDVVFAAQWPRVKRILLPEIGCIHLESGAQEQGVNWRGRKTPRFTGQQPKKYV